MGQILIYKSIIMYYKFKIFKLNIEIKLDNSFSDNQLEVLPRITILHGDMKMIVLWWLYWGIDIEFYK